MMKAVSADRVPRWGSVPLRGVLLDLDGTLLDTAEDIAEALNRALTEIQLAPIPTADVRNMIGRGAPSLIIRAVARLRATVHSDAQASLLERYEFHYRQLHHLNEFRSRLYPGVAQGLRELHELGLALAVVTNKAKPLAVELLLQLGLAGLIDLVVGGECCKHRKPDPEPLLYACSELRIDSREALMVGDSINDVIAARAAHIPVVCVPYGYNEGCDPRNLTCDAFIESLAELPILLSRHAADIVPPRYQAT